MKLRVKGFRDARVSSGDVHGIGHRGIRLACKRDQPDCWPAVVPAHGSSRKAGRAPKA